MTYNMYLNELNVDVNIDKHILSCNREMITLNFIGNNSEITVKTPSKMLDIFNNKKEFKLGKEQYKITIEEIKE